VFSKPIRLFSFQRFDCVDNKENYEQDKKNKECVRKRIYDAGFKDRIKDKK